MQISLDQALTILQENMDYVPFYSENGTFDISQIDLCYRLVQTLESYDQDVNVRLEARPAWRFASDVVRPNYQDEFVLFVDAVTGEVLP